MVFIVREIMENRIKEVMAKALEINIHDIKPASAPGNIEGWDSLKHMDLIAALEEEFNIVISLEESAEMINFEVICAVIESHLDD